MLKKKLLLGCMACVTALGIACGDANAMEQHDKPYVAIRSGLSMLENDIDKDVWNVSGAVGMRMKSLRTELEYTYRGKAKADYKDSKYKLDTMSLMINGYYDFETDMAVRPYLNLGIGASRIGENVTGIYSRTNYRFSWGGGAGLGYNITDCIALDAGYRFTDLGKNVRSNEFYGGVRFAF